MGGSRATRPLLLRIERYNNYLTAASLGGRDLLAPELYPGRVPRVYFQGNSAQIGWILEDYEEPQDELTRARNEVVVMGFEKEEVREIKVDVQRFKEREGSTVEIELLLNQPDEAPPQPLKLQINTSHYTRFSYVRLEAVKGVLKTWSRRCNIPSEISPILACVTPPTPPPRIAFPVPFSTAPVAAPSSSSSSSALPAIVYDPWDPTTWVPRFPSIEEVRAADAAALLLEEEEREKEQMVVDQQNENERREKSKRPRRPTNGARGKGKGRATDDAEQYDDDAYFDVGEVYVPKATTSRTAARSVQIRQPSTSISLTNDDVDAEGSIDEAPARSRPSLSAQPKPNSRLANSEPGKRKFLTLVSLKEENEELRGEVERLKVRLEGWEERWEEVGKWREQMEEERRRMEERLGEVERRGVGDEGESGKREPTAKGKQKEVVVKGYGNGIGNGAQDEDVAMTDGRGELPLNGIVVGSSSSSGSGSGSGSSRAPPETLKNPDDSTGPPPAQTTEEQAIIDEREEEEARANQEKATKFLQQLSDHTEARAKEGQKRVKKTEEILTAVAAKRDRRRRSASTSKNQVAQEVLDRRSEATLKLMLECPSEKYGEEEIEGLKKMLPEIFPF